MTQYLFRPKAHGYGATPANWKGWSAVAAYIAMVLAPTLPLMVWSADRPAGLAAWQIVTWFIVVALLTLGFITFTRAKTGGQWSWRWGK